MQSELSMNKNKAAESITTAQSENHIALLCMLQQRLINQIRKISRDITTANTLAEAKKELRRD